MKQIYWYHLGEKSQPSNVQKKLLCRVNLDDRISEYERSIAFKNHRQLKEVAADEFD